MHDYFETELNIPIYRKPKEFILFDKKILIGHGDGLGPGDKGYKRMKKVFTNPVARWFFKWLHPDIGVRLAQHLSIKNKLISGKDDVIFLGEENEWLVAYCKRKLSEKLYDYFIFGHRHLPLEIQLNPQSKYINLGDWISYFTYGRMNENEFKLLEFKP
jgi:UDP-2,3-diacylglucosamine hydrolase